MELGQYQIQIFVSLVVILGAAFVALICDFLKGNNEQLRELTIELKVRREEEQRRSQMMTGHTISASAPALKERMRMERVERERTEQRIEAPMTHGAPETRVASVAQAAPVSRAMAAPRHEAAPAEKEKQRKRPPSADALAAMERGAMLAASPRRRTTPAPREAEPVAPQIQPAEVFHEVFQQVAPAFEQAAPVAAEATMAEITVVETTVVEPKVAPERKTIVIPARVTSEVATATNNSPISSRPMNNGLAKKDWGSLLARKPKTMEQVTQLTTQQKTAPVEVRQDILDAVVAATATTNGQSAAVPAGFHEGYILSRLVQSRQPVSGLVVSIGVNTPRNEDGSMPESVRQLMHSLIGAGDFACQSSSEEFLLIYPNERGASAQRRLSEIAQQLWDFQLRSMGSFSILFSWGGVEVRSESIDEAIASANERMHETRRGRKLLTMEPRGDQQHRLAQAV
jgi:hypothetical protein